MSNLYDRRVNESQFDYGMRLIEIKMEENPPDLDWEDIVELADLGIHRETLRKASQGDFGGYNVYKVMSERLANNTITDDDILNELDLKKIELQKEKKKFQDQRREYMKLYDYEARYEHLKDEFISAIKETDNVELNFTSRDYTPSDKDGVLLLSDWHVGLKTENYWNKYSVDEFYNRIEMLIDKTIQYGKFHNINKLHVFGLGDFSHGLIHISTRVASEEDIISQIKIASETLSRILIKLASEFQGVEFHLISGNHGRVSPNKHDSIEKENFEEFIMWYLEAKLDNISNIKLNNNAYDNGIIVTNILGHTCLGVHGDKDNISNVAQNLSLMLKVVPEYIFTADKHHLEEKEVHGIEVIINRCLSGVDEYAKSIRKTSFAGQTFMIFDKEVGRECTYNIKLN